MCGIAGFVDLGGTQNQSNQGIVNTMLGTIPWRGPDARGTWHGDGISLGHVRLSIIDLSPEANQPMQNSCGNVLIFNGEIYNYRELRHQLSSEYEFETHSDTEVIMAAYAKWGADCVKRFNGEWSFAIYDKSRNILLLSRDRFGIKPLYVTLKGNILYFASEIRALIAAGIPARMSIDKLFIFLKFRQMEQRYQTHLEDIIPLEPGKNLFIDLHTGKLEEQCYYETSDLLSTDVPKDENEALELFGSLLQDAVRLRMHADVPVQVLLSGGLDSSAIAAFAVRSSKNKVKTLSCVFPGNPNDESYYSDMVAEALGTDHSRTTTDGNLFFEVFDEVIIAQDFPTYSEKHVARYLLYKQAAKYAKVVLEGQGGDEVFGGYGAMYTIFRDHYQRQLGVELLMQSPQKARKSDLPHFSELHPDVRKYARDVRKRIDSLNTDEPYSQRQFSILRNNLLSLLHTGDRLQMHNSIEGRYPFLDHRIVEIGMSMPVHFKMRDYDKWLLRRYIEKKKLLPEAVTRRTDKKGFSTDLEDYLLKSPEARSHFQQNFSEGVWAYPGLFDSEALETLLVDQYDFGINNNRRLLAVYSLMKYLKTNTVTITGIN
jgi:asparagine synthase (glutamine-hydrolysing)